LSLASKQFVTLFESGLSKRTGEDVLGTAATHSRIVPAGNSAQVSGIYIKVVATRQMIHFPAKSQPIFLGLHSCLIVLNYSAALDPAQVLFPSRNCQQV
jgi:hypothetical protein